MGTIHRSSAPFSQRKGREFVVFNSVYSCCLGASLARVLYRLSTRYECVICRANGTDKSSEASMPFLMARLIRHWSPQMLQLRD